MKQGASGRPNRTTVPRASDPHRTCLWRSEKTRDPRASAEVRPGHQRELRERDSARLVSQGGAGARLPLARAFRVAAPPPSSARRAASLSLGASRFPDKRLLAGSCARSGAMAGATQPGQPPPCVCGGGTFGQRKASGCSESAFRRRPASAPAPIYSLARSPPPPVSPWAAPAAAVLPG